MDNNTNTTTKLQDFVTAAAARGQITFGDVRRLERDHLPGGITTCDEAELLIGLDRTVIRADRAWKGWLATALRDFKARSHQPISREVSGDVDPPVAPVRHEPAPELISYPVKYDAAPRSITASVPAWAVLPVGHWRGMNRLAMAA